MRLFASLIVRILIILGVRSLDVVLRAVARLLLELAVRGDFENGLQVAAGGEVVLVHRLVDHDVAGLVVGVAVLHHVRALVDALEPIDFQVVDEEEHQALVAEKVLQAFKGELVQVVVDVDDLHLYHAVVLLDLQHQLRVDEAAQVENEVQDVVVKFLEMILEGDLHVGFHDLAEVAGVELAGAAQAHLVEALAVELTQVTHQVLVDHFVPNLGRLQLRELELQGVLVENPLGSLLHLARGQVKDAWRPHVLDHVVRAHRVQGFVRDLWNGIAKALHALVPRVEQIVLMQHRLVHQGDLSRLHVCLLHHKFGFCLQVNFFLVFFEFFLKKVVLLVFKHTFEQFNFSHHVRDERRVGVHLVAHLNHRPIGAECLVLGGCEVAQGGQGLGGRDEALHEISFLERLELRRLHRLLLLLRYLAVALSVRLEHVHVLLLILDELLQKVVLVVGVVATGVAALGGELARWHDRGCDLAGVLELARARLLHLCRLHGVAKFVNCIADCLLLSMVRTKIILRKVLVRCPVVLLNPWHRHVAFGQVLVPAARRPLSATPLGVEARAAVVNAYGVLA